MNKNVVIGLVVLIVVLGGGFAYYQSTQNKAPQSPTPAPTNSMNGSSMNEESQEASPSTSMSGAPSEAMTEDSGNAQEITVENKGMTFVPNKLTVKKGEKVKITFKNTGGFHDFRIDGYDVGTNQIGAGASDSFEFTPDKAGTFEFYCSVANHRQMGMKGTLTVE